MNPLALNTGGQLPCRTPLSLATLGLLGGICAGTAVEPLKEPISVSDGGASPSTPKTQKQAKIVQQRPILQLLQPLEQEIQEDPLQQQILQEDHELLSIIPVLVKSGLIT